VLRFVGVLLVLLLPLGVHAEERLALLIGNQSYSEKIGPLKNPHNDIALVGAALEKVGFKVTRVEDAGYKAIDTALKRHIQQVRRAGKDTISFVYYSGHGAADPDTQINYLIPIDVTSADDAEVWTNSLDLREIVNRLRDQTPDAVHYVVFDACREELRLTRGGTKALERKGFVPVANISGVMIAYATAPGKTASDAGGGGGVYAKTLAEELVKPGVESVMMFRTVQLKVKQAIGQDPWLSFPTLPAVYFAGTKPAALTPEQQLELTFWLSVKDSTSPAVIATYLKRYPDGEFAAIARSLVEHYDRKLKAEEAAQVEERKRIEEERKAAEVTRLEEERRAREAAIADQRKRAEEGKSSEEARRFEEQQRAELVARTEELRKAVEEARLARDAAKAAEEQRVAALKAAEEATKAAAAAIALKRDTERHSDPTSTPALPAIDATQAAPFNGIWHLHRLGPGCVVNTNKIYEIRISQGVIGGETGTGPITGSISPSGEMNLSHAGVDRNHRPMGTVYYSGSLQENSGSGTFNKPGTSCQGTFTAKRMSHDGRPNSATALKR
jgi:Caspase domain